MSLPWPSDEQERSFHRRLCDGDMAAPSDFAAAYTGPLVSWVRTKNTSADDDQCEDAAHRAVIALILRPDAYDPTRRKLAAYLCMSAQGDLRNLLRAERRHHRGRVPWEIVEDGSRAGNYLREPADPGPDGRDEARRVGEMLAAVREGLGETDRRVFDLMRTGERRSGPFAAALGLSDRPTAEQKREVKRAKDRIKKRIKRAGGAT